MRNVDLMVGDLVTFKDCQNEEKPVIIKVMELHRYDDFILASIDGDKAYDELGLDDIVGIPLTSEIMKRSGWKWDGVYATAMIDDSQYLSWYMHEGILRRYYVHKNGSEEVVFMCCGVNYAHLLQHALKMCGSDLIIAV